MGIGSSVVGPHSCQRAVHTIRSSTSVKGVQHNRERIFSKSALLIKCQRVFSVKGQEREF